MFTKIAGALGQAASQVAGRAAPSWESGPAPRNRRSAFSAGSTRSRFAATARGSAAETSVEEADEPARNEASAGLARYIFGGNTAKATIRDDGAGRPAAGQKIAMTAPVATQRGESGDWVIRFFMPSEHTMDTLPIPNDDRVRLVAVPAESVAVLRFSGRRQPGRGGRKDDRVTRFATRCRN